MDFELYINWGVVGIVVLIALVIALLVANIKVVPQAHAFVIERLLSRSRRCPYRMESALP